MLVTARRPGVVHRVHRASAASYNENPVPARIITAVLSRSRRLYITTLRNIVPFAYDLHYPLRVRNVWFRRLLLKLPHILIR